MNYPELIWCLIEMVLQKEKDPNQEFDKDKKDNQLDTKEQDETV